jgi:hypothetical protein
MSAHSLISFAECPIGLFLDDDVLCLKTEYHTNGRADAFVVESGEYYWGGTDTAEAVNKVMVRPWSYQNLIDRNKEQEKTLNYYRQLVGKLATHADKNSAWYTAKSWAPLELWRGIGFDLQTEREQQAFIFE